MLSQITGKGIAEEAHLPSIDAIARAHDRRYVWLGHIIRTAEHRLVLQVLLRCVNWTKESIFGDFLDMDMASEIKLANDGVAWSR